MNLLQLSNALPVPVRGPAPLVRARAWRLRRRGIPLMPAAIADELADGGSAHLGVLIYLNSRRDPHTVEPTIFLRPVHRRAVRIASVAECKISRLMEQFTATRDRAACGEFLTDSPRRNGKQIRVDTRIAVSDSISGLSWVFDRAYVFHLSPSSACRND